MVTAALMSCGAGSGAGELVEYIFRQPERWPRWRTHDNGALSFSGNDIACVNSPAHGTPRERCGEVLKCTPVS